MIESWENLVTDGQTDKQKDRWTDTWRDGKTKRGMRVIS